MTIQIGHHWKTTMAAVACLCLTCGVLIADDGNERELQRIRAITDDTQRLAAYDKLVDVGSQTSEAVRAGKWQTSRSTSPMDDQPVVALSLKAETPITGWPEKRHTPTLMIRYKEGKLVAYVVTGFTPNVEDIDTATATLRYDSDKAVNIRMDKSTDGEALFWQKPEQAVRRMASAQQLVFRFTPFNSSPATTTFDLTGLSDAMTAIENVSNWRVDDQADILQDRLSDLLLTDKSLVVGRFEMPLSISERGAIEIKGSRVRISLDDRWGLLGDPGSVCQHVFEKMDRILTEYPRVSFNITVRGSILDRDEDGKRILSGNKLFDKVRQAASEADLTSGRYTIVQGQDQQPEYWGQDAPKNIRGGLRDSGLSVVIDLIQTASRPAE